MVMVMVMVIVMAATDPEHVRLHHDDAVVGDAPSSATVSSTGRRQSTVRSRTPGGSTTADAPHASPLRSSRGSPPYKPYMYLRTSFNDDGKVQGLMPAGFVELHANGFNGEVASPVSARRVPGRSFTLALRTAELLFDSIVRNAGTGAIDRL